MAPRSIILLPDMSNLILDSLTTDLSDAQSNEKLNIKNIISVALMVFICYFLGSIITTQRSKFNIETKSKLETLTENAALFRTTLPIELSFKKGTISKADSKITALGLFLCDIEISDNQTNGFTQIHKDFELFHEYGHCIFSKKILNVKYGFALNSSKATNPPFNQRVQSESFADLFALTLMMTESKNLQDTLEKAKQLKSLRLMDQRTSEMFHSEDTHRPVQAIQLFIDNISTINNYLLTKNWGDLTNFLLKLSESFD